MLVAKTFALSTSAPCPSYAVRMNVPPDAVDPLITSRSIDVTGTVKVPVTIPGSPVGGWSPSPQVSQVA